MTTISALLLSALITVVVAEPKPRLDCRGTPVPDCEKGMTGPACDIPCLTGDSCGYELICHSWDATYGISVYGAYLFPLAPGWPEWLAAKLPLLFATQHEDSLNLAADLTVTDIGLTPAPLFRTSAGKLTLYRYTQSYRGFPIFGPDRLVTVVTNYQGAVAIRGSIIDGRESYLHSETQASKILAESSVRFHTSRLTGIADDELDLANAFLVAVPRAQAIGWAVTVVQGFSQVATVVVEADPAETELLPLLSFSRSELGGLADTVQVTVRAEDLQSDVTVGVPSTGEDIEAIDLDELFDMTPLLGSTKADQFRLGNERVVTYDASMAMTMSDLIGLPAVAAENPSFLASPGTSEFRAQSYFSFTNNAFMLTDKLMAQKWESILPLLGFDSAINPTDFAPRVLIFTDTSGSAICPGFPACVNTFEFPFEDPGTVPEEYQYPLNTQPFEVLAVMNLRAVNNIPTVAHEFGHVIDIFAHPGVMDLGISCTGEPGCEASCVEDTTNEATPLRETFASLIAIWIGHNLTAPGQDPTNCSYLPAVATGSNRGPHNETCRPDGDPFPRLLRNDDPSCPADNVCDKPSSPGFFFDEENNDFLPTGACSETGDEGGYQVNSFFQALWEALHEQSCSETPPYTCQPLTALAQAGNSSDVQGGALLYAARVNSMTYKGFISDMATYIACNFGEDAYFEFNEVACHHGMRDCDSGVPLSCEVCGDNQRQGGEECDGADLGGSTCENLGFGEGILKCDDLCEFDTAMCTASTSTGGESGVPTSGPTSGPMPTTSGDATSTMTNSSTTTDGAVDEGCSCHEDTHAASWPGWLLALSLLARRRKPGKAGLMAALTGCLLMANGCSDNASTSTMIGTSSAEETTTTSSADTESSSSGSTSPMRLFGTFHSAGYTDGDKWEQAPFGDMMKLIWWENVVIEPDLSLRFEFYSCGGPPEIQTFKWEADTEGIHIVAPGGEGVPFTWSSSEVLDVSIRPGEVCGEILVQVHKVGLETPFPPSTYVPGHLCTANVSQDSCEFEFKWCEGPPSPPACE